MTTTERPVTKTPRAEREKRIRRAKLRAFHRLKESHEDEYYKLFNEERESEGIEPVGAVRPGRNDINRDEDGTYSGRGR